MIEWLLHTKREKKNKKRNSYPVYLDVLCGDSL